jgi:uncharacterized protein YdeI (YjbR/CyaY-like superfamily)
MSSAEQPIPLDFRNAAEWRWWLARNHAESQGEWVYMYKKNAGCSGLRYKEALDEALCFGWIDGQVNAVDKDRFRQRWTPRRPGSVWSQANKIRAQRLAADGRMTEAGFAAIRAARKSGKWQAAYTNKREDKIPRELLKALRADSTAWRNFSNFAPTYRNMYAGWVRQAKQDVTLQRRIAAVLRRAREGRKPGIDSLYS